MPFLTSTNYRIGETTLESGGPLQRKLNFRLRTVSSRKSRLTIGRWSCNCPVAFARLFSDFLKLLTFFDVEKLFLKLKFVTDFINIIFDHFEVAVKNLSNPYYLHCSADFIYFLFV